MATAKTVLGEVPADKLGRTLCHEHFLLTFDSAKDDMPDLYSVPELVEEVVRNGGDAIRDHNIKTFVDVTTKELGRDVELLQRLASRLDINIIAATGFYRQRSGIAAYWTFEEEDAYEEFMVRELTEGVSGGIDDARVRCGVIKVAWTGEPPGDPEPAEAKATRAAARASRRTGAPIVVHCSWRANPKRNLGLEIVQMLTENGADPERVQISHCYGVDGNLPYLLEVVKTGAHVALPDSSAGEDKYYPGPVAETLAGLIGGLVRAGYGHRIVFGMDCIASWFPRIPPLARDRMTPSGKWNLTYEYLVPRLRAGGLTEKELEMMMVENAARLFVW